MRNHPRSVAEEYRRWMSARNNTDPSFLFTMFRRLNLDAVHQVSNEDRWHKDQQYKYEGESLLRWSCLPKQFLKSKKVNSNIRIFDSKYVDSHSENSELCDNGIFCDKSEHCFIFVRIQKLSACVRTLCVMGRADTHRAWQQSQYWLRSTSFSICIAIQLCSQAF